MIGQISISGWMTRLKRAVRLFSFHQMSLCCINLFKNYINIHFFLYVPPTEDVLTSHSRRTTQAVKGMKARSKGALLDQLCSRPSSWPPAAGHVIGNWTYYSYTSRNMIAGMPTHSIYAGPEKNFQAYVASLRPNQCSPL